MIYGFHVLLSLYYTDLIILFSLVAFGRCLFSCCHISCGVHFISHINLLFISIQFPVHHCLLNTGVLDYNLSLKQLHLSYSRYRI